MESDRKDAVFNVLTYVALGATACLLGQPLGVHAIAAVRQRDHLGTPDIVLKLGCSLLGRKFVIQLV